MSVQFDIRVNTHNGAAEVNTVRQAMTGAAQATSTWQQRLNSIGNSAFQFNNITSAVNNVASKFQSAWSLVDKAMNFGATKTSFEVLIGNAEQGRKLAEELNSVQQKTILGPEVFEASQTMLGFGIATKDVVKDIKMMGDVAMGNRDKFKSLSLVFSQTQATGRLMGQDLLQYINAGFNPLTVMSEKWEQFGFKSKKSVGELKEMVEKGGISSGMVAKAFEVATSQGGKFAGMMDTIGETAYGKMQQLEGSWENLKVSAGEALLPIANDLMEVAGKTIDWLGITKTAPEVLAGEQASINSLVGQITVLNESNEYRHELLSKLQKSYPDLLGKIDLENISNSRLLEVLKGVNAQYKERIELATNQLMADTQSKEAKEAYTEQIRYQAIADAYRSGNVAGAESLKKWDEGWLFENASMSKADYYQSLANNRKNTYELSNSAASKAQQQVDAQNSANTIAKALDLYSNNNLKEYFGKDDERRKQFIAEIEKDPSLGKNRFTADSLISGQFLTNGPNAKKLEELMKPAVDKVDSSGLYNPDTTNKKGKKAANAKTAKETASNISSGGNRALYIDLKINTLVGEYSLHTTNLQTGGKESAKQVVALLLEEIQGMNQALEPA